MRIGSESYFCRALMFLTGFSLREAIVAGLEMLGAR